MQATVPPKFKMGQALSKVMTLAVGLLPLPKPLLI
ncbi:hypothetical protein N836_17355 [Leptolyngbya sp. Heron Island J]|nr:hypothetical protein N836_17355 [Leptolyngbya sp. Heron Island J]